MRRKGILSALAATAALGIALTAPASAPTAESGRFALPGTVTYIVDGDTVDVRLRNGRRERVRLIGIDSPELRPLECLGVQAKARASQLAQGKPVRLVGDATQDTRDRYRRLLAYVVLPDQRDLGRQLIAEGFGTVYVHERPFQRVSSYRAAERSAKAVPRGLWQRCSAATHPLLPPPPPSPPPPPPSSPGNCHASYPTVCTPPPPPDLDCGQIGYRNFHVRHDVPDPDPHRFDGDKDGVGWET